MKNIELTVKDVLTRKSFQKAKVKAGAGGLGRHVRWSHILEVREFDTLINGGELILTTGISMTFDLDTHLSYIRKLIELEVSALCIEITDPDKKIPPEVLELADAHNFPIIVFEEVIRFVDLTQDLHTTIINRHHKMISELDRLSGRFIELSLTSNGILKILQELHDYFRRDVLFITDRPAQYFFPSAAKETEASVRRQMEKDGTLFDTTRYLESSETGIFATVPVRALGQVWGRLCLAMEEPLNEDFYFLILDRAGLSISQILLRNRTVEERKQNLEDKLVRNLITGIEVDPETIHAILPAQRRSMCYRIFTIHTGYTPAYEMRDPLDEELIQRSMIIRNMFHKNGLFPLITFGRSEITILAFFNPIEEQRDIAGERFKSIKQEVENLMDAQLGISKMYQDITQVRRGYLETKDVIFLQQQKIYSESFYEKLGIYRLLLLLKRNGELETYVNDHLGSLIAHDKRHDSGLLETLTVYLECGGMKKEASERLFIVRQTLYHRLNKLEVLLGENFMESHNRLALEVAVKGYKMLICSENTVSM